MLLWATPHEVWEEPFWGLGAVKHEPQGARLHSSITCSWRPGGFGLCQDICSRFAFYLWSSWFSARVRSLRGCKAHKASKAMEICLLHSQYHCFGPVELHRGYSSLICTPMDETNEFSWIQSRNWTNSVFTYFFGTDPKLHPVSVKTGMSEVGKGWPIPCKVEVRWLEKVSGILQCCIEKMERASSTFPLFISIPQSQLTSHNDL